MDQGTSSLQASVAAKALNRNARVRDWTIRLLMVGLFLVGVYWFQSYKERRLGNESFATGYVLTILCIALTSLSLRKRLIAVDLGPVAHWQHAHHWSGTLCMVVYIMHAGFITDGWLESLLAIVFWSIIATGLASWFINRTTPKRLQAAGPAILRSDIPAAKHDVMVDAYQLALRSAGAGNSGVLADLYRERLARFFQSKRSLWYRCFPNGRTRRSLAHDLDLLDRYLDEDGRELKRKMKALVGRRDDLDFQLSIQQRMRFWAILHSSLLGAFVVLSAAHILLAHLYSSHW